MTESSGREPGGWELLRAVQSINGRLDEFAKGFVPVAVYNLLVEDVRELNGRLTDAKGEADRKIEAARSDAAEEIRSIRTELDNAKKTRAQTWTAIGLLAAGGAITLVYSLIRQGLGMP